MYYIYSVNFNISTIQRMLGTKQKIIDTSVALFNTRGLVNIKMRDIANECGISLGNLTYHFKKKEDLLESIHDQIIEERNNLLAGVQLIPSIVNIHNQLIPLMELYKKYQFFYLDVIEIVRAYPEIAAIQRGHIQNQITYIKAILDYSVGSGNMNPELREGHYQELAHTVWMILSFWLSQQLIRNDNSDFYEQARKSMWSLVLPLLTEKGVANFNKIYEEEEVGN